MLRSRWLIEARYREECVGSAGTLPTSFSKLTLLRTLDLVITGRLQSL